MDRAHVADFIADRPPSYRPPDGATGVEAISGVDPFILHGDGKGWLVRPGRAGWTARCPRTTSRRSPRSPTRCTASSATPVREIIRHPQNPLQPSGRELGSEVFPYVATTYRLTEHPHAGGMSRMLPYLSELQPEFFCEVLAAYSPPSGAWRTGAGPRSSRRGAAVEARVPGHRADPAHRGAGPPAPPDRAAVSLGRQRPVHRRLRQRPGHLALDRTCTSRR